MVESFILSKGLLFEDNVFIEKKVDLCFLVSSDLQNSNISSCVIIFFFQIL